jgi:ABC-type antimicrobial peptide transport system permease subunit
LSPLDRVSFALATGCVVMVGAVAAFLPAWRAAKIEPMVALRYE